MALVGSRDDINGFVLNFAQKEMFNGNYFIGLLPKGYPQPLRGDRMDVKFYPAGAESREESRKLVPAKPLERAFYSFPAGAIDPKPVHMVFPDGMTQLPHALMQSNQPDMPSVGAILGKIMKANEALMDMLKVQAERDPETVRKMREQYSESDMMTEDKLDELSKLLDTVMSATSKGRRSRSR